MKLKPGAPGLAPVETWESSAIRRRRWRNTAVTLNDQRSKREIAFHEKAGPRQVDFVVALFAM
jgi:hypothetical protein